MKKGSRVFICQSCGEVFSRWAGKCESCGKWNTIEEETPSAKFEKSNFSVQKDGRYAKLIPLSEVNESKSVRTPTGLKELDVVLGGGIVSGSLVLIGGEPGVGKSTLILEICGKLAKTKKIIYISGEESSTQISIRAKRMNIEAESILLSSECIAERIVAMVEKELPDALFIDSIQTISRETIPSQPGTVTQLRECTQIMLETAKRTGVPIFLIGHITKEGSIAGPKILEHLVDTVLYFEADKLNYYRMLRGVKNRFGAVGDIAVFEMGSDGLVEVKEKRDLFLSTHEERIGSVVSAVMEGSRALSVEVQALVSRSTFSQARRMAEGLDNRRLVLIAAVLEKFLGIKTNECDIFANLAGGLTIDEPALDLSVSAAIISSYLEKPLPKKTAVLGEVGLSGEVRSVGQLNLRLKELAGVGMEMIVLPQRNLKELSAKDFSMKLNGIGHIRELEGLF
ncbi:MAG: DNA repair protein RadA [Leptospiraceae bacterium]|nr:DNA repair protein RadA [Leptospiraceae bacterium]